MLPTFQPLPLSRSPKPFSHPDWVFEVKWDGFRALTYIEDGRCRLVSRNGNEFKSFPALNIALPVECRAKRAVLDGEIVCLDESGNSQFQNLLFRRGEPRFYAFDLLWCNGEDLRYLPLSDRKHRLRGIVPPTGKRLLYCDHVEGMGEELFQLACERDLEGIVAKRKFDPYLLDGSATWLKIRNRNYSQWIGREELFERERSTDPDWQNWSLCVAPVINWPIPMARAHKKKTTQSKALPEFLKGWQKIAEFLGQPTSVAQRWARDGMPVQRHGKFVIATPEELNKWLSREAGEPVHVAIEDADLATELKRGLAYKGIEGLQRRVDQQGKDVYSLAYLNLLLRRRADLQGNGEMRAKDLRMADQLVNRIKELHKSEVLVIDIPLHPAIPPPPPPPPPPPTQPK